MRRICMSEPKSKREHWQKISFLLICFDALAIYFSFLAALLLRFDLIYSAIPKEYIGKFNIIIFPYIILCIVIFIYARLYKSIWRFASYNELIRLIMANLACSCFLVAATFLTGFRMPALYYTVGCGLQFVLTTGLRFY